MDEELKQKILDLQQDLNTTLKSVMDRIKGREQYAEELCMQTLQKDIGIKTNNVDVSIMNSQWQESEVYIVVQ